MKKKLEVIFLTRNEYSKLRNIPNSVESSEQELSKIPLKNYPSILPTKKSYFIEPEQQKQFPKLK